MDRVHKEVHGLGLKTGLKNDNFWSEIGQIGSGFREPGGAHPQQEFPGVSPRAFRLHCHAITFSEKRKYEKFFSKR